MAETVYNVTIPSTSATISYSPYVIDNANSGGWQSLCPTYVTNNGTNSWICDPESAHTTSSFKARVGVYLVGNTTNNLGYDISLDGVHFPGNFRSNAQSLFSSVDMKPGRHTITLTIRRPILPDNPGSLTLKEIVVNAGTGRSGATVTKKVLDDNDQSISYYAPPGGNWTIANAYPQTAEPEGLTSFVFHDSYWTNATATIGFKGAGISVYGACYSHSRYAAYSASIDGSEETQYDGTINLYSIGGDVKQRAGNCLRYFKTGLDAGTDHELILKVKDMGRLAVDWVEVFTVEGGQAIDGGSGVQSDGNSTGLHNSSTVAIIAGTVSGGIVLLLALLTILICIRQKRPDPQDILTPPPTQTSFRSPREPSFTSTPFAPVLPHVHTDASGASVPQPQTPGSISAKRRSSEGATTLSYTLGGAPLASPGLSSMSSYTGSSSSGPGWPDSAGYHTTAFNHTAPLSPSMSRPPARNGLMGSFGPESGAAYLGSAPMGGDGVNTIPGLGPGGTMNPVASASSPGPPSYEQVEVPEVARLAREKLARIR